MKRKSRYHQFKRVISHRKLNRIFEQNLDNAGICTIYRSHNEGFTNSLQAVQVGDIIYAVFPCKRQKGNRLETYAIRYSVEFPLDHASFRQYPMSINKAVEF